VLTQDTQTAQSENMSIHIEMKTLLDAIDRMKAEHASKLAAITQALETKTSDVEDCKTLLKTMMDEEKATRAAKNDLQKQVMSLKEQVAQLTSALSRLKDENSKLASRASDDATNDRIHTLEHELRIASEIQARMEDEKERLAEELEEAEERAREEHKQLETERTARSNAPDDTPRAVSITLLIFNEPSTTCKINCCRVEGTAIASVYVKRI
jgi:chromosome segregation ATPase